MEWCRIFSRWNIIKPMFQWSPFSANWSWAFSFSSSCRILENSSFALVWSIGSVSAKSFWQICSPSSIEFRHPSDDGRFDRLTLQRCATSSTDQSAHRYSDYLRSDSSRSDRQQRLDRHRKYQHIATPSCHCCTGVRFRCDVEKEAEQFQPSVQIIGTFPSKSFSRRAWRTSRLRSSVFRHRFVLFLPRIRQ